MEDLARRQSNSDSSDGSMQWQAVVTEWRRCDTMYLSWSGGHGPFNLNATSYPDGIPYGSSEGALSWQIAYLVGNHNYEWTGRYTFSLTDTLVSALKMLTRLLFMVLESRLIACMWKTARAPPNTTFYFDLQDTSTGQDIGQLLPIHINSQYAKGLSSCQVDYEGVTTPSPTAVTDIATSSAYASQGTSSSLVNSSWNETTSETEAEGNSSTSQSSHSDASTKALHAGIIILSLALAGMLFMQYRLRRRLARLQKGHSTVGRWMNHHDLGFGGVSNKKRHQQNSADESASSETGRDMRPMSNTSNLYATSESNGRLSAFFEHRSVSRNGRPSTPSTPSTSRDLPTRRLSSSSTDDDPFGDGAQESADAEELDEDMLHRSASQQKRYSLAESAISDSNTATSGRVSSVAPSDQLSSVGNVSVVSDDHYHRNKAFTITQQGGSMESATKGRQFLEPHLALLDSRR